MRNPLFLLVTVVTCVLAFSCKSSTGPDSSCGDGILCASVNGKSFVSVAYNSSGKTALYTTGSYAQLTTGALVQLMINGDITAAKERFNLVIAGTSAPKSGTTYSSNSGTIAVTLNYYQFDPVLGISENHWATDSKHSGSVTLTAFDTTANLISGTFSFTAMRKDVSTVGSDSIVSVTSGNFANLKMVRP